MHIHTTIPSKKSSQKEFFKLYKVHVLYTNIHKHDPKLPLIFTVYNNPNQAKTNGMTVLMLAAYDSKMEKIKLLLKYGAKKDIKDSRGLTALDYFNKYSAIRKVSEEDKIEIKELLKE